MMPPSDPADAAATDARTAMHLPGAVKGWNRITVRLPADAAERADWLTRYADALKRAVAGQP